MQNERIKPTKELKCTEECPSFNAGTCMISGLGVDTVEIPCRASGTPSPCSPSLNIIQDAYKASRKKAPRQEYRIIKRPFTGELVDSVIGAQRKGWRVAGGVIMNHSEPPLYMQALVRDISAEPLETE